MTTSKILSFLTCREAPSIVKEYFDFPSLGRTFHPLQQTLGKVHYTLSLCEIDPSTIIMIFRLNLQLRCFVIFLFPVFFLSSRDWTSPTGHFSEEIKSRNFVFFPWFRIFNSKEFYFFIPIPWRTLLTWNCKHNIRSER